MSGDQQNVNYDYLAVEGIEPLMPLDVKRVSDEQRSKTDRILELGASNPIAGVANAFEGIYPIGMEVLPVDKEGYKADKLSDFVGEQEGKISSTKSKKDAKLISDSGFLYSQEERANITRQRIFKQIKLNNKSYVRKVGTPEHFELKNVIDSGCFIDPSTSYLKFTLVSNINCDAGIGSFANIFRETTFTTYDKTTVNSLHYINQYNVIDDYWQKEHDWSLSVDADLKGYTDNLVAGVSKEVIIPLKDLFSLFKCGRMIPSEVLNKSLMRFELEDPRDAFVGGVGTYLNTIQYTVSNVSVVYDSHYVDQHIVNVIHNSDMRLYYDDYKCIRHNSTGNTEIELYNEYHNAKHVIVKRVSNFTSDSNRWEGDYFQSLIGNQTNFNFRYGIQRYPEFETSKNENFLNNLLFLSNGDRMRIQDDDHHVQTLGLSRNRMNDAGIVMDDRNQVRYTSNTSNQAENIKYFFFSTNRDVLKVKGLNPIKASHLAHPDIEVME